MNSHSCTFVTPRDRAIFQINQELLRMHLSDMTILLAHATALNRGRQEDEAALWSRYPTVGEPDYEV